MSYTAIQITIFVLVILLILASILLLIFPSLKAAGIAFIVLFISIIILKAIESATTNKPTLLNSNLDSPQLLESYIHDANISLNNLKENFDNLNTTADNFFTKRTNSESSAQAIYTTASNALTKVEELRNNSNTIFTNTQQLFDTNSTLVNNMQTSTANSGTSLQNIKNIVNGISPTVSNAGNTFGSSLSTIEYNKNYMYTNVDAVKANISEIQNIFSKAQSNEQTIYDNLQNANKILTDLQTYFNDLINDLTNTPEYSSLNNAKNKATKIREQLNNVVTGYKTSSTTESENIQKIKSLISNLDTSISQVQAYLDNIVAVFTSAGSTNSVRISQSIRDINTVFVKIVATVGSVTYTIPSGTTTPYPITTVTPTLVNGSFSITQLYDKSNVIISSIIDQYNTAIGYYNTVTGYVNDLNTFTTNILNTDIYNSTNSINQNLTYVQNKLLSFFPGSTTPVPNLVYNAPPAVPTISQLPSMTPYVASQISDYYKNNYVQYSGPVDSNGAIVDGGFDLPNQPVIGTLSECQNACNQNNECIGFSREKTALDTEKKQCYLKKLATSVTYNDSVWNSYVKPSKITSWPVSYNKNNYTQLSTIRDLKNGTLLNYNSDLFDSPINGTLTECQNACNQNNACIGFSREKTVLDTDKKDCYLKKFAPSIQNNNDTWNTFVKSGRDSDWKLPTF